MSLTKDGVLTAITQATGNKIPMDSSGQIFSPAPMNTPTPTGGGNGGKLLSMAAGLIPGGGVVNAGLGAAQMLMGLIMQKRAGKSKPSDVDPQVQSFLSDLNMKRKNLGYSGATSAVGMNMIKQNQAAVLDKIPGAGGGNIGQIVTGLGVSELAADQGVNGLMAMNDQRDQYLTSMAGDMVNRMSARKMDLGMHTYLQKLANGASMIAGGVDNFGNAIAKPATT